MVGIMLNGIRHIRVFRQFGGAVMLTILSNTIGCCAGLWQFYSLQLKGLLGIGIYRHTQFKDLLLFIFTTTFYQLKVKEVFLIT
jgi:hypothetical protein